MKVVLINTSKKGGAAEACLNLLSGLKKTGLQVTLLTIDDVEFYKKNFWEKIAEKWHARKVILYRNKLLKDAPKGFDYFSFPLSRYKDFYKHPAIQNADIINFHWVTNLIDYPSFFKNIKTPIVWTLHDVNAFTGGCHYTFDCRQYEKSCESCPQLAMSSRMKAHDALKMKLRLLHPFNYIISPSKWISQLSLESQIFKRYEHYIIPNGVDSNIFKYLDDLDKNKHKLGVAIDKFVISFVATDIATPRKGVDILLRLQEQFSEYSQIEFLCVGNWEMQNTAIRQLGFVHDKHKLAEIYSGSDVFIIPSRQDNLPNTMLEALCCGTPVIGFNIGGIPDAIQHGQNGYIVEPESFDSFVHYIKLLLYKNSKLNDRKIISVNAIEKFSLEKQAKAYNSVYRTLLNKSQNI
jgi:glycosyltransferase involved in cell wall biosynthesis